MLIARRAAAGGLGAEARRLLRELRTPAVRARRAADNDRRRLCVCRVECRALQRRLGRRQGHRTTRRRLGEIEGEGEGEGGQRRWRRSRCASSHFHPLLVRLHVVLVLHLLVLRLRLRLGRLIDAARVEAPREATAKAKGQAKARAPAFVDKEEVLPQDSSCCSFFIRSRGLSCVQIDMPQDLCSSTVKYTVLCTLYRKYSVLLVHTYIHTVSQHEYGYNVEEARQSRQGSRILLVHYLIGIFYPTVHCKMQRALLMSQCSHQRVRAPRVQLMMRTKRLVYHSM